MAKVDESTPSSVHPEAYEHRTLPEARVREVEDILNNRPLKCLQFLTPSEELARSPRLKKFVDERIRSEYYRVTNV